MEEEITPSDIFLVKKAFLDCMRIFSVFCCLILFETNGISQTIDSQVEEIQKEVLRIDTLITHGMYNETMHIEKKKLSVDIILNFKYALPARISVTYTSEDKILTKNFYIDLGHLIYVNEEQKSTKKATRWEETKTFELAESAKERIDSHQTKFNQFYLYFNEIIFGLVDGKAVESKKELKTIETALLFEADELLKFFD